MFCIHFKILLLLLSVILYAVSAVYFAGVMVRLMLTLTPVVCMLAAIGFSTTLDKYLVDVEPMPPTAAAVASTTTTDSKKKKKEPTGKKEVLMLSILKSHFFNF